MKRLTALMVLFAFTLLGRPQQVRADHAAAFAQECAEHVQQIVQRCQNAAAKETHECVRRINALQAQGRERAARRVARECIEQATTRTENCVEAVHKICSDCIDVLLFLGEPELARRMHNVCEDAVEKLRGILQREKQAIQAALENRFPNRPAKEI